MLNNGEQFIQIIALKSEVYAVYKNPYQKTRDYQKINLVGLTNQGEIVALDMDKDGDFEDPRDCSNFVEFHEGSIPKKVANGKKSKAR